MADQDTLDGAYRAAADSAVKRVVSHCSYLINLAGTVDIRSRSETALIAEIERCHQLGIEDVVLHPGFAGDQSEDTAIRLITDFIIESAEPDRRQKSQSVAGNDGGAR